MINYITGDLFNEDNPCKVIVHGCNCVGVMGAGVARIVAKKFPISFDEYYKLCQEYEPEELLGTIQVTIPNDRVTVINAFTQLYPGAGLQVDYDAVRSVFTEIAQTGFTEINIPKIGAGLAGGDWEIIESIINEVILQTNLKVNCYVLEN